MYVFLKFLNGATFSKMGQADKNLSQAKIFDL